MSAAVGMVQLGFTAQHYARLAAAAKTAVSWTVVVQSADGTVVEAVPCRVLVGELAPPPKRAGAGS